MWSFGPLVQHNVRSNLPCRDILIHQSRGAMGMALDSRNVGAKPGIYSGQTFVQDCKIPDISSEVKSITPRYNVPDHPTPIYRGY